MNKTAIKNFAIAARKKLISEIIYKAGLVGITKDGIADPVHKSNGIEMYDIGTNEPYSIKDDEIKQRKSLVSRVMAKGFGQVIEEVAYTWFNRIIAVRFMEINDYLPSRVRVLSSEIKGKAEPDIVTQAPNVDLEFYLDEIDTILQLKHDNRLDELFRMLFIRQCNELNQFLPELFERTADYTELLLSISFTNEDSIIRELVNNIDEEDFKEQVEIIGWMYQYYNTELKDDTFAKLKANVKITKERIPAATQLFTPDWIVRYMVENSLGRLWLEGHPDVDIKTNWQYYLDEAEQEPDVQVQLEQLREDRKKLKPEDIRVIDPCMGSGHILVYAFDVLMDIYKSSCYDEREAVKLILQYNLYGLDIDNRAYQLAYFAIMMKARGYSRRILSEGITPQICAIQESRGISEELIAFVANNDETLRDVLQYIVEVFKEAKEYGSIINVECSIEQIELLLNRIEDIKNADYSSDLIGLIYKEETISNLYPIIKQAEIMVRKYEVVVTNPPYMGNKGMTVKLTEYVKQNFPDSKADMFSIFIEKSREYNKVSGYYALITQPSILFLSTFEKLRNKLILEQTISSLLHMGRGIFGIDFGSTAFILMNHSVGGYKGCYFRLHEKTFKYINPEDIERLFLSARDNHEYKFNFSTYIACEDSYENSQEETTNKDMKIYYESYQEILHKIPGMPIAYWVSQSIINAFSSSQSIGSVVQAKKGLTTADNDKFLKMWYEVKNGCIELYAHDCIEASNSKKKWFPHNKGGGYRKWYGNNDYIINWLNDGVEIKNFHKAVIRNSSFYFRECCTWSDVSSSNIAFRFKKIGSISNASGPSIFGMSEDILYVLAFGNSIVARNIVGLIAPTIHFEVGQISSLPLKIAKEELKEHILDLTNNSISISKNDWDTFETSWDFKRHPFLKHYTLEDRKMRIKDVFNIWQTESQEAFTQLKANEEELNSIFIEIYGLEGELTPEVEEKDVTIRRADLERDIKSFISYAIGCIFGRYSLDVDGLTYAGGDWDISKYKTIIPTADNIVSITDEEYFEDDIVCRFVEFVKVSFGAETVEENLDFIAKALGNKGNTSREIIRNYFIKDFYKDHVKIYQKKPIYWLFDSGKENGFKALIYMHRYDQDTVGKVRANYLHRTQKAIENSISRADMIMDSAANPAQKAKAVKDKEKLVKQLAETRIYDAAIGHIANQRIAIDLDDGVTVNYAKFQGVEISSEGKKTSKINLLGKI